MSSYFRDADERLHEVFSQPPLMKLSALELRSQIRSVLTSRAIRNMLPYPTTAQVDEVAALIEKEEVPMQREIPIGPEPELEQMTASEREAYRRGDDMFGEPKPDEPADPDKDRDFEDLARILNRIHERDPKAIDDAFTHVFRPPYTLRQEQEPGELENDGSIEVELPTFHSIDFVRGIEKIATARGMLIVQAQGPDTATFGEETRLDITRAALELLTAALEELVQ